MNYISNVDDFQIYVFNPVILRMLALHFILQLLTQHLHLQIKLVSQIEQDQNQHLVFISSLQIPFFPISIMAIPFFQQISSQILESLIHFFSFFFFVSLTTSTNPFGFAFKIYPACNHPSPSLLPAQLMNPHHLLSDICNSLLTNLPAFILALFQFVFHTEARVILLKHKPHHIILLLITLRWPFSLLKIKAKVLSIT